MMSFPDRRELNETLRRTSPLSSIDPVRKIGCGNSPRLWMTLYLNVGARLLECVESRFVFSIATIGPHPCRSYSVQIRQVIPSDRIFSPLTIVVHQSTPPGTHSVPHITVVRARASTVRPFRRLARPSSNHCECTCLTSFVRCLLEKSRDPACSSRDS